MVERLQKTLQKLVGTREVAGLSVLVEQGDREICFLTEGMADIAENTPMRRDTIYRCLWTSSAKPLCTRLPRWSPPAAAIPNPSSARQCR